MHTQPCRRVSDLEYSMRESIQPEVQEEKKNGKEGEALYLIYGPQ